MGKPYMITLISTHLVHYLIESWSNGNPSTLNDEETKSRDIALSRTLGKSTFKLVLENVNDNISIFYKQVESINWVVRA